MQANEDVVVIVVNWNCGVMLHRSVNALMAQTQPIQQITIVDNASFDGSTDGIERLGHNVRLICLQENLGFAGANNVALRDAPNSRWIALINPDAFAEPDWLERLMSAAAENPEFVFFGSRMLVAKENDRLDGTADVYHVSGAHWRRSHGLTSNGRDLMPEEIFSPCAAAALYRRDTFVESGGFDNSFFCYAEDVDLGFRLQLLGYRCLYVPDAVVHHIGSATTGRHSDFSVYHGHRNLVWVYFKNMPWPLFWLYIPQHILLNLISILWFSLRGQGRVILKAKWDAIKGLPRILRERKKVQANRKADSWELRRMMARGLLKPYLRRNI
jgi:GT2 family glycosyltransferase